MDAASDVIQHFYNHEGKPLPWSGETRLLAVSAGQLRATPLVIAAAASVAKAQGILGAARAGLIDVLVTDLVTAEAVLALAGKRGEGEMDVGPALVAPGQSC